VLAAVLLRLSWKTSLALAGACSLTGVLGALATSQEVEWGTGYLPTFHYAGLFIAGFLLAQNINRIHAACARLSSTTKACLALAAFTVYTCGHLLPGTLYSFSHIPIALAAVMLLVTGVCSRRTSAFMKLKPVAFLGDIAYGMYLYHVIVLLTLVHLLYGRLHMGSILALTAVLTVGMAYLSRTLVELPCIRIGRQAVRMYQSKVGVTRQQPASAMAQNSQASVLGSPA
jgi:peptidoglycan/LPS O-acetylase OafA/YrhL